VTRTARTPRSPRHLRHHTRISRLVSVTALAAALTAAAAGCSSSGQRQGAGTAFPASPASESAAPGALSVSAPGTDLVITGATVRPSGDGKSSELSLTVTNAGSIPEHLAAVTGPGGAHATIAQGSAPAGVVSTAGILLSGHSTVKVGGSGDPVVTLPAAPATGSTESLAVEFAVAGMVHLTAVVQH